MAKRDFSLLPQVRFNRSKFSMPHGIKTSMSAGFLYPLSCVEVLPGDSFSTHFKAVVNVSSSFLKPVIDNAFLDVYHFYVPLRLVYDNAEGVFGNPNPSSYIQDNLADFPTIDEAVTVSEKTVYDYLGVAPGVVPPGLNVLKARAFALIYDKWFRNENTTQETFIYKGLDTSSELPNNNDWSPTNYTGKLPKVSKKKDYFTSCNPKPQKGVSVTLPLGRSADVYTSATNITKESGIPLRMGRTTGDTSTIDAGRYEMLNWFDSSGTTNISITGMHRNEPITYGETPGFTSLRPMNLKADLTTATAANVNDLRFAFQLQKMLERDALYGSRYNEYLLAHFGVSSPDSRLQLPEYLGGGQFPISVQRVAQTSQGTADSPLANLAGFSVSAGDSKFSKGFVEHGFVFTVACIRQLHTYQQGIHKSFFRKDRNDVYDPLFSNLGEQPVYRTELFVSSSDTSLRGNIFGYNEAWADYRYIPSQVTGELRSSATNSFDIWHFADKYNSAPTLSQSFTEETPQFIDRALSVPSTSQDQFILDGWFNTSAIRVMPTYSVPGLIDHH